MAAAALTPFSRISSISRFREHRSRCGGVKHSKSTIRVFLTVRPNTALSAYRPSSAAPAPKVYCGSRHRGGPSKKASQAGKLR